ncbi:hypothetical protein ACOMHN_055387 [Nucella lapillus]
MSPHDRGCSGSVLPLHTGVKGLYSKGQALVHSDLSDPGARYVVRQWAQFLTPQGTDLLHVCTCHPTDRQAFCSDHLPEGVHVLTTMDITRKTDQGSE